MSDRRDKPGIYAIAHATRSACPNGWSPPPTAPSRRRRSRPDGSTVAFNVIAGGRSRLMVEIALDAAATGNIADPDEDVFPFRPQWVSPSEVLYTADGKIKRRPAAGGAARVVEFTADVSFARPAFTPKRREFDLARARSPCAASCIPRSRPMERAWRSPRSATCG